MLQLRIGFPSGRYFGASADDPREPEWPPHPSRVYSALVAAAYAGGRQPSQAERQILQRLEAAPAPSLSFPDADVRAAPDSYVPVNDIKSRIAAKKGESQGVLLPNRQVRQFPSAFLLGEPEISMEWPVDVTEKELEVLDDIAARVTHVGTSHSFATASFSVGPPHRPRLQPSDGGGHYLRVTRAGRLDELDRLVTQGYGTLRRPAPLCELVQSYAPLAPAGVQAALSGFDWVTLRLVDASWGADTAYTLARALRSAVMSILGDHAPVGVHGHDDDAPHVAWLPLPDVGHVHARGRIRGIAVALPLRMPESDRTTTLAALVRLQRLTLPDGQIASLSPAFEGAETPLVLRAATWGVGRSASRHWSTVTPVLLDRPPKRITPERLQEALAESLVRAGFPRPVAITDLGSSDFAGAPQARDIPTRVPRLHARIMFDEPIEGPVIAGRWKNFGIGLFRPTPGDLQR